MFIVSSGLQLVCVYLIISGLLWGYNIGMFVQDLIYFLFIARLNWQTEANDVSRVLFYYATK